MDYLDAPLDRPIHPPVRITSNLDYHEGNGVRGGSGTADDPYVISNWTFLVQGSPNYIFSAHTSLAAGVVIDGADAHVVLRNNTFLGTTPSGGNGTYQVAVESTSGVLVRGGAANVTVEGSRFQDVGGGSSGAVGVRGDSQSIALVDNVFRGGDRPTIASHGSEVRVQGNDIEAFSYDCCISYATVYLANANGSTAILDNRVHTECGLGFGCGHHGIEVEDSVRTDGPLRIENNTVTGEFNGIVISTGWGSMEEGTVHVKNNVVDFPSRGWYCLWFTGHDGVVEGNVMDGCGRGLRIAGDVEVGRNLYNGGITLDIRGLNHTVVDPSPEEVTWFRAGGNENLTVRNLRLTGGVSFDDSANVTVEDSTFGDGATGATGHLALEGRGRMVVRNVTAWGDGTAVAVRTSPGEDVDLLAEDVRTVGGDRGLDLQLDTGSNVTVRNSSFEDAEDEGAALHGFGDAGFDHVAFDGNRIGLRVNAPGGDATVRNGSFVGNADYGVTTEVDLPVDARWSWWGNASGPEDDGNPDGTGDAVLGPVDYDPWLETAP